MLHIKHYYEQYGKSLLADGLQDSQQQYQEGRKLHSFILF